MTQAELKELLDEKYHFYHARFFIEPDPISIPHQFDKKEDIEISGFLAATLAWGQRPVILRNANLLMKGMDFSPHEFVLDHRPEDRLRFKDFKHRTFNFDDLNFFLASLQNIYRNLGGLENCFKAHPEEENTAGSISRFREAFFSTEHLPRSKKHVSDPKRNSACKRLNMFLRWMVRKDEPAIDFGIWNSLKPSQLSCPLDLHSGRVARQLGLLKRKQNDWKAVEELDDSLRKLDPEDPVKYDFALFGMGVFENKI